eukprot:2599730-Pyramimonas_sp.AAC.1
MLGYRPPWTVDATCRLDMGRLAPSGVPPVWDTYNNIFYARIKDLLLILFWVVSVGAVSEQRIRPVGGGVAEGVACPPPHPEGRLAGDEDVALRKEKQL